MNKPILDYFEWVQANEADLNAGWEEEFNRRKFADMDEYLGYYYAVYVKTETHKRKGVAA